MLENKQVDEEISKQNNINQVCYIVSRLARLLLCLRAFEEYLHS